MAKKSMESDAQNPGPLDGLVIKSLDFINPTQVFELGSLGTVTTAMVDIFPFEEGFVLKSKNKFTNGCMVVYKSGLKCTRWVTAEECAPTQ